MCSTKLWGLAVVLSLTAGMPVYGQFNASLQGTVQDSSGAIVPGAQITLLNNGTHASQQTTSNDQGFYRFNQLPSGTYTLTASSTGFTTLTADNIQVAADLPQTFNPTLQPAGVSATTTVSANLEPTLQTADASISGTISTQAVQDLPSFGRDPYELIRTMPGITGTGGRSATGTAVPLGNTTGPGGSATAIFQTENQVQVSSSGQRVELNVYDLDGVNINSLEWGGAAVVTPNTESVADMTVITSDYSAEDGRNSGAHIKTTTRSGTNTLHGSGVFEYEDPNLNAYNKYGGPNGALPIRLESNYRQYAGSLGGPILKNKLFFFLSYEGLHNKTTTYGEEWVTTPQYRNLVVADRPGSTIAKIFNSVNANPRILSVLPVTCSVFGASASSVCRQAGTGLDVGSPGPGTNPAQSPYYTPGVNIGGGFDGIPDIEYVQYYLPAEQIGNQFNARFDYNLTSNDLIFGSAYITKLNSNSADSASAGAPDADIYFKPLNTAVTAAYIKTLGSTLINELRSNLTRYADNGLTDNAGVNFGIPRIQVEGYPFGDMQVAGAPQGPDTPAILAENTYEIRDHVIKVIGTHSIRVGGQYRWEQDNDNLIGGARPLYSFSNLWNLANSTPIYEGIYADAYTGGPPNAARYFRDHGIAAFVQDDWHATESLTLNLGLRWEFFSPLTEKRNQLEDLFLGATGPSPLVDAQVRPVNQLWTANYKDFMPKFGFAYAPVEAHQKFVLRGGFGMAYNRQNDVLFANSREDNPNYFNYGLCCGTPSTSFGAPYGPFNEIQFVLGNSTSPFSYPANSALATGVNPRTGTPNAIGGGPGPAIEIYGTSPHLPDAYTFLYSLEAQTQIAPNLALIVGYQGAESRHLIRLLNQNFLYPQSIGPLPDQNTSFYAVYFPTPDVNSSYNALNVRLSKTVSHGLSLDATYTWSKSIDMLSAEGPGANTNQTDPVHAQTDEYGPSDFDATDRFNSNVLWTIPVFSSNKGLKHTLFGGWQVGAIVSAYSGFPWTPVTGFLQSVATVTSAATISPVRPTNYYMNAGNNTSNQCFINACNFGGTSPTSTVVGTNYFNITTAGPPGIGRNSFRGPRYFSTDASIAKRFALPFWSEQAALELRGFAFNVFNTLNLTPFQFGDLDTHIENPNFGRPASAQAGRSIELEARVSF